MATLKEQVILELKAAAAAAVEARKRYFAAQEEYDRVVKSKELAGLVGKTFKYPRNCYSCPKTEADYWPVYARVVSVADGCLEVVTFETDSRGDFSWKRNKWFAPAESNGVQIGFVPCPGKEYNAAFRKALAKVRP